MFLLYDQFVHHVLETDGRDDPSAKALIIKKFYNKIYMEYLIENENKRFVLLIISYFVFSSNQNRFFS